MIKNIYFRKLEESEKTKVCNKCKKELSTSHFTKVNNPKRACFSDGFEITCKTCVKLRTAMYQEKAGKAGAVKLMEEKIRIENQIAQNENLKWCSKGQHLVEKSSFSKCSRNFSGLQIYCYDCMYNYAQSEQSVEYRREYFQKNKPYICKRQSEYSRENRKKVQECAKKWCLANPEKIKICRKKSKLKNRDQNVKKSKIYYQNNKLVINRRGAEYRKRNIGKLRVAAQKHRKNNPELYRVRSSKRRCQVKAMKGNFTLSQWLQKLDYFGNRCYLCLESLKDKKVHIEHRIPISRGGTNWIANIAPACASCNLSKHNKTEKEFRQWQRETLT